MKKKYKILLCVSVICFCVLSLITIGFCLKSQLLSLKGNINPSLSNNINATISKSTMSGGTYVTSSDSTNKTQTTVLTQTSSTLSNLSTWTNINVKYNSTNDDIVFSFTVRNNSTSTTTGFLQVDVFPQFNNESTSDIFVNRDSEVLFPNVAPYNTTTAGQKHIFNYTVTIRATSNTPLQEINDISILFDFKVYTPPSVSELTYNLSENSSNYTASATGLKDDSNTNLTFYPVYKNTSGRFYELTKIGANSFSEISISNLILCNSIQTIGDNAFVGASLPINNVIIIPNSVTYIGGSAFETSAVRKVLMNTGVECDIGVDAFFDCGVFLQVELSNNLISIGNGAFYGFGGDYLETPDSLISIGAGAFESSNIKNIVFGSKLQSIASNAFVDGSLIEATFKDPIGWKAGTTFLSSTSLSDPSTAAQYLTSDFVSSDWEKHIPLESELLNLVFTTSSNGTALVRAANTSITTAEIPEYFIKSSDSKMYKVTSINVDGFNECSNLTSVTIPNSVTSIGAYTFNHCSKLTSVTIPNSVRSIGTYAFSSCTSLTSVTIPNSVISIGTGAFNGCSSLTSVTISNKVTSIRTHTFYLCSKLTSVTIPNSVISIGTGAFNGCSSLTSVTIPNSVTSIGMSAFRDCSNLTSVTFNTTTGWKAGAAPLSSTNLSNTSTAATWLKTRYVSSIWTRT